MSGPTPKYLLTGTKTICLLDAMNLVYRSHFAFKSLASDEGQPTGILFGVLRALLVLRKTFGTHIVFCWDNGLPSLTAPTTVSWRRRISADYKVNRQTNRTPEETASIFSQCESIRYMTQALGYPQLGVPGLEADDVIGLVTGALSKQKLCIYSSDRDFHQLLNENVTQLRPRNGKSDELVTAKSVYDEYGFGPSAFADYLALGGDKSDGIKTLRGFGPKTASLLVRNGVSLQQLKVTPLPISHWDQLTVGRQVTKIADNKQVFLDAYQLAHIPRTPTDDRLKEYPAAVLLINLVRNSMRFGYTEANARQKFVEFCLRYDLKYFVERRNEFLSKQ